MKSNTKQPRGRLPSKNKPARQEAVLLAALEELQLAGYERLTMQKVAKRARCTKETLYAWYTNKEGLLTALIKKNADDAAVNVELVLDSNSEPAETLTKFCTGLIGLLTSKPSIVINHAAMSSPELAKILLKAGRYRIGPMVEQYLSKLFSSGFLKNENEQVAFATLYGLAINDLQIRVLLGDPAPSRKDIKILANRAVSDFMILFGTE